MTDVRKLARVLGMATAQAGLLLAVGCGKPSQPESQPKGQPAQTGAAAAAEKDQGIKVPDESPAHEGVTTLDAEYQLEPPRTTAGDAVPTPWQEAKAEPVAPAPLPPGKAGEDKQPAAPKDPNAQAGQQQGKGARPVQPAAQLQEDTQAPPKPPKIPRKWLQPAVLIGRSELFVAGKPVAKVACRADQPEMCQPGALRGPTGKQAFSVDPAAQGALTAALQASGWSGQDVIVLADRRIGWDAIEAVRQAVQAAGGRPVLVAATYEGQLARILPPPGATATPAPTAANAPLAATPAGGESSAQPDAVPDDLTGVTVGVTGHGLSLLLARKSAEPMQPELMGNVLESLSAWAERLHAAAPSVTEATLSIEADAPFEEVVRAIDALRDTCAKVAKGTPCHDRRVLFPKFVLLRAAAPAGQPAAEPTPTGQPAPDGPQGQQGDPGAVAPTLRLGVPSPRLEAAPLGTAGGLRLERAPSGIADRDARRIGLTPPPSVQRPNPGGRPAGSPPVR